MIIVTWWTCLSFCTFSTVTTTWTDILHQNCWGWLNTNLKKPQKTWEEPWLYLKWNLDKSTNSGPIWSRSSSNQRTYLTSFNTKNTNCVLEFYSPNHFLQAFGEYFVCNILKYLHVLFLLLLNLIDSCLKSLSIIDFLLKSISKILDWF